MIFIKKQNKTLGCCEVTFLLPQAAVSQRAVGETSDSTIDYKINITSEFKINFYVPCLKVCLSSKGSSDGSSSSPTFSSSSGVPD